MLAKVYSCAVIGLEAAIVEVEVDTANGLPSFVDVGSDSHCRSPLYGKADKESCPTGLPACFGSSTTKP
jgi:hypothetical protein